MRIDMIDHGSKLIEQWRVGARPMRVMVGKRLNRSCLPDFAFDEPHDRGKNRGSIAPPTDPAVTAKHGQLLFLW